MQMSIGTSIMIVIDRFDEVYCECTQWQTRIDTKDTDPAYCL